MAVNACNTSTTTTTPPSSYFTITVTIANENVFLGTTVPITATASDGRLLVGTWQSDNPAVATVSSTGLVTAVSSGLATIFLVAEGRQGGKTIRSLPNFAGTFTGSYRVDGCTQTGAVAAQNVCANAQPGTLIPFQFVLSQTGPVLSGNVFILGISAVPGSSAEISANGDVTFSGNGIAPGGFTVFTTWRLSQRTIAGGISGTIAQRWTAPGLADGEANVTASISSISKQ